MLYQFSFKNFKSYKSETIFDMRAENIKEFEESLLLDKNGERLLPVSAIYGPNAGGKSGVLEALVCLISIIIMPRMLLKEQKEQKEYGPFFFLNNVMPYKFDDVSKNEPTEFEIYFSTNSNEYKYNLSTLNNIIIKESLYKKEFNAKKPAQIFSREKSNIKLGQILKKANATTNVSENLPYLTFMSIVNDIDIINDIINWFENITAINYARASSEKVVEIYGDETKELELSILKNMDIDICDYRIEKEETDKGSEKIKAVYLKHKNNEKEYELEFHEESEGTKKLFKLIPAIINAVQSGKLIIIDEMDAKLHPKLLRYIIMIFKNKQLNTKNSQLIFTSQDLTTMSNQVFRRDEIWFACQNIYKESELYSLYEIRDEEGERIRASASFSRQYLSGKYGADPYLDKMLNWEEKNVEKTKQEE